MIYQCPVCDHKTDMAAKLVSHVESRAMLERETSTLEGPHQGLEETERHDLNWYRNNARADQQTAVGDFWRQ